MRVAGSVPKIMHSFPFHFFAALLYFGLCFVTWRSLPVVLSPATRAVALLLGALLYFPGLALVLWARLALGEFYYVSSSLGAALYTGHRLITSGPFALVRHPMYLGIVLFAPGGLLMYRTWTMALLVVFSLVLIVRARREEQALAVEFGHEWQGYCQRVPAWIPHLKRKGVKEVDQV